jgi:hypothetical protein
MLGSTLAASITLNTTGNVEFGQGVAQTAACDEEILVTPISAFDNASDTDPVAEGNQGARFEFTSFTVTGVDATACADKTFTVNAYEATGASVETYIFKWAAGGGISPTTGGTFVLGDPATSGTFNLEVPLDLTSTADNIAKLTLETSN